MAGMDDLVQFLRARLDDDERVARGSAQPSLSWQNFDMDGELRDDANAGTVAMVPREETRAHIARHDPARVLREVEAKRALLGTYLPDATTADEQINEEWRAGSTLADDLLCLLALPYADHPNYRPEWRP